MYTATDEHDRHQLFTDDDLMSAISRVKSEFASLDVIIKDESGRIAHIYRPEPVTFGRINVPYQVHKDDVAKVRTLIQQLNIQTPVPVEPLTLPRVASYGFARHRSNASLRPDDRQTVRNLVAQLNYDRYQQLASRELHLIADPKHHQALRDYLQILVDTSVSSEHDST